MRGTKPRSKGHADAITPAKPEGLDNSALAMWDLVIEHRKPWLDESDGPALQALCECWSLRSRAVSALADDSTDKDARIAFTQYQAAFERMATRFGMTPVDRERLGVVIDCDDDPAAEFLR